MIPARRQRRASLHRLRTTNQHNVNAWADHAGGRECGCHARRTGEHGREGWHRRIELGVEQKFTRNVAPSKARDDSAPHDEVRFLICELLRHCLEDRD